MQLRKIISNVHKLNVKVWGPVAMDLKDDLPWPFAHPATVWLVV